MSPQESRLINIRCGSCEKTANQRVVSEYTHTLGQEHEIAGEHFYDQQDWLLRLSLCSTCESINLSVEDDGGEITLLFPKPPAELEGLPEEIARAYKAARAVRLIDANAFAVLLGRVMELICIDRNAKGKTLYEQLKDLAGRGEIPGPLADMADQLRNLRNIGAHASLGELSKSEVPILDDLCGAILEYVYAAPNRVARVAKRIEELKKRKKSS
jgi:hypothetical protein